MFFSTLTKQTGLSLSDQNILTVLPKGRFLEALIFSLLFHIALCLYGLVTPHLSAGLLPQTVTTTLNATLQPRLISLSEQPSVDTQEKTTEEELPSISQELTHQENPPEEVPTEKTPEKPISKTGVPEPERTISSQAAPATVQYLTGSQLTSRPAILEQPVIELPPLTNKGSMPIGKVVIKIAISTFGLVDWIKVEESTLPAAYEGIITQAFKSIRYQPGEVEGKAVASLMIMEVSVDSETFPELSGGSSLIHPQVPSEQFDIPVATPATPGATQK